MRRKSNYDKFPIISVRSAGADCWENWPVILDRLRPYGAETNSVICIECYPGVLELPLRRALEEGLHPAGVIMTTDLLKCSPAIERMVGDVLGDDPVFGRMNRIQIEDFFDERKLGNARDRALEAKYPRFFVPKYAMVTFHRTPYAVAAQRGAIQDRMLGELCDSVQRLEDVDWAKAEVLVQQELTPLLGV